MVEFLRQLALMVVMQVVRFQFPDVATVSSQDLAFQLANDPSAPVMIDTREPREYAVSHLPGALNLTTVEAIEKEGIAKDRPLVVYCTVGYRSAYLARELNAAGYGQVANLDGSIIQWHNQGNRLLAQGELVQKVHPYDKTWGLLLNPNDRSDGTPK